MAFSKTLGRNLRSARKRADMSQRALAHAIGHSGDQAGSYISMVETGIREPRTSTLCRMAKVLGVAVESLLPVSRKSK